MKTRMMIVMICVLALTSAVFAQKGKNGNGGTALPAQTIVFNNGTCTAKFVRSASGIINETSRVCTFDDPFANAKLQFRPVNGTPNPNCDPDGLLVPQFQYTNWDPAIAAYFGSETYNVCVYLEAEYATQTGTVDSANPNGATATLPATGNYSVCVSGTYTSSNHVGDAEYVSTDGWMTATDGLTNQYAYLGAGFGDVQINGQFVNWGAYNTNHSYCTTVAGTKGGSLSLRVFDGDSNTNEIVESWYGDNSGSLSYVVKFLGY